VTRDGGEGGDGEDGEDRDESANEQCPK